MANGPIRRRGSRLTARDRSTASGTRALFLNQRGGRLSVKGAHDIITAIAAAAGLEDDEITAHVYADPGVMPRSARKSLHVGVLVV